MIWKDPICPMSEEEGNSLYEPPDNHTIKITSDAGRIGRFHWHNQGRYMIEQFNADGTLYDRSSWEIPGNFAFVWNVYDFIAFLMS